MNSLDRHLKVVEQGNQIPRHLHQVWVGTPTSNLHKIMQDNIEYLKGLNPTWTYHLWDDESVKSFILEHYGEVIWAYYQRISPVYGAARADFFRYLLIYQQGGVYIDIKSSLTKPLDEVLTPDDKFILTHWDNLPGGEYEGLAMHAEVAFLPRGEYVQWCIASVAGHPFLRAVILQTLRNIDQYDPFVHKAGLWGVLRTTGPVMYTKTIESIRPTLRSGIDYRLLNKPQDIALRYSIYDSEGIYGHKKALKVNYNKACTPIILMPNRPFYTRLATLYLFVQFSRQVLRDKIARYLK